MGIFQKTVLFLMVCSLACQNLNAMEPKTYGSLNLALVQQHVLPRYEKLSVAFEWLEQQAQKFCAAPREANVRVFKTAYHRAMDAWMGIQHIRFGPIDEKYRFFKIQFWPDTHGTIGKQLKKFLAKMAQGHTSFEQFKAGSVAIQGLPALEQLLFSKSHPLFPQTEKNKNRCELSSWIATNLAQIAQEILQEWQEEGGFQTVIATASAGNEFYLSDKEVAQDFFSSFLTGLQWMEESKLVAPLGKSEKKARPKHSESWRSERSLENILFNLQGLIELYQGGELRNFEGIVCQQDEAACVRFNEQFQEVAQAANQISMPLSQAVLDPKERVQMAKLRQELKQLFLLAEEDLLHTLKLHLGFNALDGDGG